MCIEVEKECVVDISIGTIFDPVMLNFRQPTVGARIQTVIWIDNAWWLNILSGAPAALVT